MALFDRMGGLLGDLGDYGFGVPKNTGLIADPEREAINKRALMSGGISALLTYLATPKNLNAGSALPYLGRAGLAGFGASQDVVDRALNTAYRNKILAGKEDNMRTYESDRKKITEIYDPITKETKRYESPLDAPKEAKEPTLPTSAQEFERAKSDPAYMKFLREKWDAENKARRADIQAEESAYNIRRPQQSFTVTADGKTYYFKDQNSANAFRQKAGIK
jgi:hypothetical protein